MQIHKRSITLEAAKLNIPASSRRIEGYAVVFNQLSDLTLDFNVSKRPFRELIEPSALDATLADSSIDVQADFNHNSDLLLARESAGTLSLRKDDYGLFVSIELPNTTTGNDVLEHVRVGNIRGMSFTYGIPIGGAVLDASESPNIHRVKRLSLYAVSPVVVPAYPQTSVSARDANLVDLTHLLSESRVRLTEAQQKNIQIHKGITETVSE